MRTATLKLAQTTKLSRTDEVSILLIEDTTGDAAAITKALVFGDTMDSFRVQCKPSLAAGLTFLAREKVDIVLLDLGLPDADALTALKEVHGRFPELPIVIITGHYSIDRMSAALRQGAQEFLIKGECSAAVIRQSIYQAIARKKMEPETLAEEQQASMPTAQPKEDSISKQVVLHKKPLGQFSVNTPTDDTTTADVKAPKRLAITYHYINGLTSNLKHIHPHNEKHIGLLASYMEKSGCNVPLLIDQDRRVIAGYPWLLAAHLLDLEMVPTLCVDQLTREQQQAFMRADSYLAAMPVWTDELVAEYLALIADMKLNFTLEIPPLHLAGVPMVVMSRLYALLLACGQSH